MMLPLKWPLVEESPDRLYAVHRLRKIVEAELEKRLAGIGLGPGVRQQLFDRAKAESNADLGKRAVSN
jgi:hypothetical protein